MASFNGHLITSIALHMMDRNSQVLFIHQISQMEELAKGKMYLL